MKITANQGLRIEANARKRYEEVQRELASAKASVARLEEEHMNALANWVGLYCPNATAILRGEV
jgi:hypothetical protein